jgi:hypothetical protein
MIETQYIIRAANRDLSCEITGFNVAPSDIVGSQYVIVLLCVVYRGQLQVF